MSKPHLFSLSLHYITRSQSGLSDRGMHGQHRPHRFWLDCGGDINLYPISPGFGLIDGACYYVGHCGK